MKKIILICLFVLPFYYMNAQRFRAGFYIGAAITDIDGTDNIDNDNDFEKYGLLVAGTVSAQISTKSAIQMEIRYIRREAHNRQY